MKQFKKEIASLCFSFLVGIFALIAYFSLAWFAQNKTVGANGMQVKVKSPDVSVISVNYYAVMEIDKNEIETKYTFVNVLKDDLPRYDPAEIEYQQYKRAIVLKISVDISGNTDFVLTARTDNGTENLYADLNHLSNVATFKICSVPKEPSGEWESAEAITSNNAQVFSFTAIQGNTIIKNNSIKLYDLTTGTNTLYLVIEYNEVAISKIGDYRLQHDLINVIEYQKDIWLSINPKEGEN